MKRGLRIAVVCLALASAAPWGAAAAGAAEPLLSAADRAIYRAAFEDFDRRQYDAALTTARGAAERLPAKVLLWAALTAAETDRDFGTIARFLAEDPDWPGQAALRRNAERAMPATLTDARVIAWFAGQAPLTPAGAMRYAEALTRSGADERAGEVLRRAWVELDFDAKEERAFRVRFGERLRRADELARLDRLLWDHRFGAAKRQARRLGSDRAALAEARIALARSQPGVDWAIKRVPAELRNDPGLVYERARWRQRRGRYEAVIELLDPPNPDAPRAEIWWPLRKWAAREAYARGDISVAYHIAAGHGMTEGLGFAEGEWLAGWIALRFLDQPETAYGHFKRFNGGVSTPISRARGAFWAGEAARVLAHRDPAGDWPTTARRWYEEAASHGATFYGQLAGQRIGRPIGIDGPTAVDVDAPARRAFEDRELVRAVRLLGELERDWLHEHFLWRLKTLARSASDYRLVADLARQQRRPDIAVAAAKEARGQGIVLFDHLYPAPALDDAHGVEPALVLAVIRQESAFYDRAVSRAGARGLMQLMPGTAKRVAKKLKLRYSRQKLLSDPDYNLRLGRAYLADLIRRYNGSYVLALAAYNAGPLRADRWIRSFGDPRDAEVDPIDWIESLPFDETRNYVQRILESLAVYRQHLGAGDSMPPITVTRLES